MRCRLFPVLGPLVGVALLCQLHAASASEPYCGLYSAYAALRALGVEAKFEELCDGQFLSGRQGSTALDLIQVASKYRVRAEQRDQMSLADLRSSSVPVILHTSTIASGPEFDHWMLFLGMWGDAVRVYDGSIGVQTISAGELLGQWDGVGILIGPSSPRSLLLGVNLDLCLALVLVVAAQCLLYGTRILARYPAARLALLALLPSVVWHLALDYGFVRDRSAVLTTLSRYSRAELPIVDAEQVAVSLRDRDIVLVDARVPKAYQRAHLKGAINIPVSASPLALRGAVAQIPLDKRLIVYCQSDRCRWADAVGRVLSARGYRSVAVFRGGMEAWSMRSTGAHAAEEFAVRAIDGE